jgi:hypothetical protein
MSVSLLIALLFIAPCLRCNTHTHTHTPTPTHTPTLSPTLTPAPTPSLHLTRTGICCMLHKNFTNKRESMNSVDPSVNAVDPGVNAVDPSSLNRIQQEQLPRGAHVAP